MILDLYEEMNGETLDSAQDDILFDGEDELHTNTSGNFKNVFKWLILQKPWLVLINKSINIMD